MKQVGKLASTLERITLSYLYFSPNDCIDAKLFILPNYPGYSNCIFLNMVWLVFFCCDIICSQSLKQWCSYRTFSGLFSLYLDNCFRKGVLAMFRVNQTTTVEAIINHVLAPPFCSLMTGVS